ncbi:MAG: FHIPEP family type III secretion protein [Ilumatobacteraceae bacterium]
MNRAHLVLPTLIVGVIICLIVPVPTAILDVLLAVNIVTGLVTLSSVLNVPDPVNFSSYPSLLLVTTTARVALTVSTTRSILLHAKAGQVVETFGRVVVGSNVVVGLVIFLVLTIINLMVITKGSNALRKSRLASAWTPCRASRWPSTPTSPPACSTSGELAPQRERIAKESDFYGAMDGAVKFVKGDAIAGLIVVFVNLIGGFTIGVVSYKMPVGEAAQTYALLTVGDGLVAQLPALLYALATGMLVNRVKGEIPNLGRELGSQLASSPLTLRTAGAGALAVAFIPGMPKIPFFGLAGLLFLLASRMVASEKATAEEVETDVSITTDPDDPEVLIARMRTEPLELRLAYDCTDLVAGGDLLPRIRELRRQLATELGFVLPHVVTSEDATLAPGEYRIAVWGVDVGSGRVPQGPCSPFRIRRCSTRRRSQPSASGSSKPVFGLTGYWIPESDRGTAGRRRHARAVRRRSSPTSPNSLGAMHPICCHASTSPISSTRSATTSRCSPTRSVRTGSRWRCCTRCCARCCPNGSPFAISPGSSRRSRRPAPRPGAPRRWPTSARRARRSDRGDRRPEPIGGRHPPRARAGREADDRDP